MEVCTCDYCGKEIKIFPSEKKYFKKHYCGNECRFLAEWQKDIIHYEKDYAYILLTKNSITQKVIFDIEDIEKVKQYKWHLHLRKSDMRYDVCTNTYAENKKRKYIIMPRYLLNYSGNKTIDHINRNTLDNRKINLRIVNIYENNLNKNNNTSGCVGVSWDKARNKWHVTFKSKNLGRFDTFEEAVKVRKQAEQDYHLQNNVWNIATEFFIKNRLVGLTRPSHSKASNTLVENALSFIINSLCSVK